MKSDKEPAPKNNLQQIDTDQKSGNHLTQVENAHASGLGAMGRNDEKLPAGEEEAPEPQEPGEPVY